MMSAHQFHNYISKLRLAYPDVPVEYDIEEQQTMAGEVSQTAEIRVGGKHEQFVSIVPPVVDTDA